MFEIERGVLVKITPTPLEIANSFCDFDADQQAEFFNYIEQLTDKWESGFVFQLQSITDSKKLTDSGRRVMELIGEYAR